MTDATSDAAARALARLRDPDHPAVRALAAQIVADTTATPLRELASARWVASQIATALRAATHGPALRDALARRLDEAKARWGEEQRTVGEVVPAEVVPPLRTLLGRPFSPPERLTARIVRQRAVRELVAQVLEDSISRFGRTMRGNDTKIGDLGRRAASRGRALGKGLLAVAGVADVASELAHAVADEFEHALERRVKDFLGEATGRALQQIVGRLSDPGYAETFAEFRVALLDEVLETPIAELVEDLDGLGPLDALDVVLEAVRAQVEAPDFIDRTEASLAAALDEAGDGTLDAWLGEVGLREVWTDATTALVARRLAATAQTPAFEAWLVALLADDAG
jgi:hypothetical protein